MRRAIPLLTCLMLLMAPAVAQADDAAIRTAWNRQDATFKKLGKSFNREAKAFARRGYEGPEALLENLAATRSLLRQNTRGVRAAEPSSATGRSAKRWVLRSNSAFAAELRSYARGVRLLARGRRAKGNAALSEGDRWARKARKRSKKAKKLLSRAGV